MRPDKKSLLFFSLLFFSVNLWAFVPPVRDTMVNGLKISYNYFSLDYCNSSKLDQSAVLSIGVVGDDSTRTGSWYFFTHLENYLPKAGMLMVIKKEYGLIIPKERVSVR